jgi:hypothetical protein
LNNFAKRLDAPVGLAYTEIKAAPPIAAAWAGSGLAPDAVDELELIHALPHALHVPANNDDGTATHVQCVVPPTATRLAAEHRRFLSEALHAIAGKRVDISARTVDTQAASLFLTTLKAAEDLPGPGPGEPTIPRNTLLTLRLHVSQCTLQAIDVYVSSIPLFHVEFVEPELADLSTIAAYVRCQIATGSTTQAYTAALEDYALWASQQRDKGIFCPLLSVLRDAEGLIYENPYVCAFKRALLQDSVTGYRCNSPAQIGAAIRDMLSTSRGFDAWVSEQDAAFLRAMEAAFRSGNHGDFQDLIGHYTQLLTIAHWVNRHDDKRGSPATLQQLSARALADPCDPVVAQAKKDLEKSRIRGARFAELMSLIDAYYKASGN